MLSDERTAIKNSMEDEAKVVELKKRKKANKPSILADQAALASKPKWMFIFR